MTNDVCLLGNVYQRIRVIFNTESSQYPILDIQIKRVFEERNFKFVTQQSS